MLPLLISFLLTLPYLSPSPSPCLAYARPLPQSSVSLYVRVPRCPLPLVTVLLDHQRISPALGTHHLLLGICANDGRHAFQSVLTGLGLNVKPPDLHSYKVSFCPLCSSHSSRLTPWMAGLTSMWPRVPGRGCFQWTPVPVTAEF